MNNLIVVFWLLHCTSKLWMMLHVLCPRLAGGLSVLFKAFCDVKQEDVASVLWVS